MIVNFILHVNVVLRLDTRASLAIVLKCEQAAYIVNVLFVLHTISPVKEHDERHLYNKYWMSTLIGY